MSVITAQEDLFASLGLSSTPDEKGTNDVNDLGLDTFLKLMITQMNNQDPFKPMENGEFLGQIAQFASVTGLDTLNESFSDLSTSLTSAQALQAGALVGREVLAPIGTGRLNAGSSIRGQVELATRSTDVTVRITDQVGQLVREIPMGSADAGPLTFNWDGLDDQGSFATPGLYDVEVSASVDGKEEILQTQLFSNVESVNISGVGGLTLNLEGLGPISFNSVSQIF